MKIFTSIAVILITFRLWRDKAYWDNLYYSLNSNTTFSDKILLLFGCVNEERRRQNVPIVESWINFF